MKKVSAANITHLTLATAANAAAQKPDLSQRPSVEDLLLRARNGDPARAAVIDAAMAKLPEGFALAPVLYTRIARETNARLESEYLFNVRPRFLKFLGETQKANLRALGICEYGIARMARGLDPATEDGRRYDLSVDHIIERFGSGALSNARQKDPARPDGDAETYPVNHFGNLILMQQDIHDLKNTLNAAQGIHDIAEGESIWVLMLVPVTTARQHGYVAAPQPADAALGQLKRYQPRVQQQIGDTLAIARETMGIMTTLGDDDLLKQVLAMLESLADRQRPRTPANDDNTPAWKREEDLRLRRAFSVADLAVSQPRDAEGRVSDTPPAHRTLRGIFNATIAHDRDARRSVERDLRPRLEEVRQALKTLHARAEAKDITSPGHPAYEDFVEFFRGRKMRSFCMEASRYPLPEARALLEDYRRIERAIQARGRKPARSAPARKAV